MAMSLADKLAAQLNSNNQEMQKAKEEVKKPVETKKSTEEVKPVPKAVEKKVVEKKTEAVKKTEVKPEKKTVTPAQKKEAVTPQPVKKESKPASKQSYETWTNQTFKELEEIASFDEKIYKPITVDIDNWRYIDEIAKSLTSNSDRKITHNEYIELLIKKEVDEFNSLSDKEKDIVQATVSIKPRTNKTKTIGLRASYWNAFDQLCIIHGHCPKCNMMNLLIDKDIERDHPKLAAIRKITL